MFHVTRKVFGNWVKFKVEKLTEKPRRLISHRKPKGKLKKKKNFTKTEKKKFKPKQYTTVKASKL